MITLLNSETISNIGCSKRCLGANQHDVVEMAEVLWSPQEHDDSATSEIEYLPRYNPSIRNT